MSVCVGGCVFISIDLIFLTYCSIRIYIYIYRVSQEECEILRESVP